MKFIILYVIVVITELIAAQKIYETPTIVKHDSVYIINN
jgi:hypothetical protein